MDEAWYPGAPRKSTIGRLKNLYMTLVMLVKLGQLA